MVDIIVYVQREPGFEDLPLPHYQTEDASGLDLYAAVDSPIIIKPGEIHLVSTGLRISIPKGYEGQVRPRSGLALKYGIGVLNTPGTIDADYRGIVGVILYNLGKVNFVVNRGDRIAQLVIAKVEKVSLEITETMNNSERNNGGFGSTGIQ